MDFQAFDKRKQDEYSGRAKALYEKHQNNKRLKLWR
jgi:hypothetical protein